MSDAMLEIRDLHVRVEEKPILRGVDLVIRAGEVHAVMGPNGSGKSTLANVLAGREGYEVTQGSVLFRGKDLLSLAPEARARAGVFLAFQYPVEIPGVGNSYFMKAALEHGARGARALAARRDRLLKLVKQKAKELEMDETFSRARQRRLLGRREEAQRDPAAVAARARARGAGRDGLRPRHRRAGASSRTA